MEYINNATNKLEYMDFLYKNKKEQTRPSLPNEFGPGHYASRPQASRRS